MLSPRGNRDLKLTGLIERSHGLPEDSQTVALDLIEYVARPRTQGAGGDLLWDSIVSVRPAVQSQTTGLGSALTPNTVPTPVIASWI